MPTMLIDSSQIEGTKGRVIRRALRVSSAEHESDRIASENKQDVSPGHCFSFLWRSGSNMTNMIKFLYPETCWRKGFTQSCGIIFSLGLPCPHFRRGWGKLLCWEWNETHDWIHTPGTVFGYWLYLQFLVNYILVDILSPRLIATEHMHVSVEFWFKRRSTKTLSLLRMPHANFPFESIHVMIRNWQCHSPQAGHQTNLRGELF